jgi:hypothetical protein
MSLASVLSNVQPSSHQELLFGVRLYLSMMVGKKLDAFTSAFIIALGSVADLAGRMSSPEDGIANHLRDVVFGSVCVAVEYNVMNLVARPTLNFFGGTHQPLSRSPLDLV